MNSDIICYNAEKCFTSPLSMTAMNCTHCNTEIPEGASFCPQCGTPLVNKPIFPPYVQNQPSTGQYNFLIGCACILGALSLIAMFIGLTLFNAWNGSGGFGSSCCGTAVSTAAEPIIVGTDFNLYGKTLDDEDFDWESLREKYVLVKFTSTWCGPCKGEIPGMLEAYEKYHDKGLEIVSVYIWEHGDSVAKVKKFVESEKLPWIIVSESLTAKSGAQSQGDTFGIKGVPTMLLVNKEGKVLVTDTRGERLKQELKKLFDESDSDTNAD